MKTVFNFFSRSEKADASLPGYEFREPRFAEPPIQVKPAIPTRLHAGAGAFAVTGRVRPSARPDLHESTESPRNDSRPAVADVSLRVFPDAYAECVASLRQVVADRKSPYNTLVAAADRLKDFIPNETARLQAALAIQNGQWPREVLSLAISNHIADIENARLKLRGMGGFQSTERKQQLSSRVSELEQQNRQIDAEIAALRQTRERNATAIENARKELEAGACDSGRDTFLDQAARNLTDDLLAKKVILDLP
jgi:outer membrane murein-binding lipoprotein Lpp